jgi:3-hydroxybutyryl-CoA dehydrogenase
VHHKHPIQVVGICGIGQMGAAAAVSFQRAGYRVLLWARDPKKLAAVQETLDELDRWIDEHVGPRARASATGSIERVDDLRALDAETQLVLDAIAEDMDQKVELFKKLTSCKERGAIFLTTTSGLSVTDMGRRSGTGPLLVGTHFWNPPHLMPLVEVVRGEDTPDEMAQRVCEVVESIGKIPVRVEQDVPGFIGNRLLHAMWREAIYLVQRGIASPEDIDKVARLTFGLRTPVVGPLENMDLVGLDLVKTIHDYLLADLSGDDRTLPVHEAMVERGDLGMKTGRGFYDWQTREGSKLIELRNRQIVRQLAALRKMGEL